VVPVIRPRPIKICASVCLPARLDFCLLAQYLHDNFWARITERFLRAQVNSERRKTHRRITLSMATITRHRGVCVICRRAVSRIRLVCKRKLLGPQMCVFSSVYFCIFFPLFGPVCSPADRNSTWPAANRFNLHCEMQMHWSERNPTVRSAFGQLLLPFYFVAFVRFLSCKWNLTFLRTIHPVRGSTGWLVCGLLCKSEKRSWVLAL